MKILTVFRTYKNYIFLFLVIWLFLVASFYVFSIGTQSYRLFLHMRRYILPAFAATCSMYIWKRKGFPLQALLPHVLMALLYCLIFNVSDFLANRSNALNLNNYGDPQFAAIAFSFTVLLRVVTFPFVKTHEKVASAMFGFLHTMLVAIPVFSLLYFLFYGNVISEAACIAFLQTTGKEAREFAQQTVGNKGIAAVVAIYVFILLCFIQMNRLPRQLQPKQNPSKRFTILIIGLLLGVTAFLPYCFCKTSVISRFLYARFYMKSMAAFQKYQAENFVTLKVTPEKPLFFRPSTIIYVIGESAGRNFMSVYGYKHNDTTPWQRKMVMEDARHFLRFNHAYTSYGSTLQALERALTQKNQYNKKEFSQSVTIMDIARKAGYKTYWFSNQNTTPITLVARTADVYYLMEDDPKNKGKVWYDDALLRCLEQVNPNENNFIVLHVMGCHELTKNRFPPEFTKFGQPGVFDLILNYEDAMAYNDYVLQQIFAYAKAKLNLQAMIMFSDHGANPYRNRTADNVPFINLRIPLICYLSDEYQTLYPKTVSVLRSHLDTYFTNDLMYETVSGILGVKSDQIDEKNSLTSPLYQYTRETLKTDLGTRSLADDDSENRIEIVK